MPLFTLRCQFVFLKKEGDVTQSCYDHTILSRSSSQRLEQVGDQGMRDGKGFHNIRDS